MLCNVGMPGSCRAYTIRVDWESVVSHCRWKGVQGSVLAVCTRALIVICVAAAVRQRLWDLQPDDGDAFVALRPNRTSVPSPNSTACANWCVGQGSDLAHLQRCHATCLRHPALARHLELLEAARRQEGHRATGGSTLMFASFYAQGKRGAEVQPQAALASQCSLLSCKALL